MVDSKIFGRIFLDFRGFSESLCANDFVLELVEELVSKDVSLTMLAQPAVLNRIGLLDLPAINSVNFQVIPEYINQEESNFLNIEKKQKIIPIHSECSRKQFFDPCATRMQIFINEYGEVYPCQGLSRLPGISLCNVGDPFDGGVFFHANGTLFLHDLFSRGPHIPEYLRSSSTSICEQHRNMFL